MKVYDSISKRLSRKILQATALLFIICIFGIAFFSFKQSSEAARKNADTILEGITSDIEAMLTDTEIALLNNLKQVKEHQNDPDYLFEVTRNILEYNPRIVGSAVAFRRNHFKSKGLYFAPYACRKSDGGIASFSLGSEEYDYFSMDWFRIPLSTGENSWTKPYFDDGGADVLMTTFSLPVWDDENEDISCIFTADLSISDITNRAAQIHPYEHSYVFIVNEDGSYLAHPDPSVLHGRTLQSYVAEFNSPKLEKLAEDILAGKSGSSIIRGASIGTSFVTYAPLSNGWSAGIVCSYHDVLENAYVMLLYLMLVSIFGLLGLYFLSKKIMEKNLRPVTQFADAAKEIAGGNFHTVIPEVKTEDELKVLKESLSDMLVSFNKYIKDLAEVTTSRERMESELHIASAIQSQMLPTDFPKWGGTDLFASLSPAREVGGDLYDFTDSEDNCFFSIGDVSGKGVPASLYMAITRSALRMVSEMGIGCDSIVSKINNNFCKDNNSMMFMTMFVAKLDKKSLKLSFCNAGHNPIVIVSPDGKASFLAEKTNIALGIMEDFAFESEAIQLEKGSRIILYTDGVTEAETASKDQYGENRLLEFCESRPVDESSEEFIKNLIASVKAFTSGNDQNDDITAMSVKI